MSLKVPAPITIEEMSDQEFDGHGHVTIDPEIAFGKPVIAGTRIAVEFVLDLLASGWDSVTILENYPDLSAESLRAVFAYAADLVHARQQRPGWMSS